MMKIKMKVQRFLNQIGVTSKIGKLLFLIVVFLILTIALKWFTYIFNDHILSGSRQHATTHSLIVLILSKRESFDRREAIRNTWASGHNNVFFVVGEQYCQIPPEYRVLNKCIPNNLVQTREALKPYLDKEDMITRNLLAEPDIILVPSGDETSDLPKKVTESLSWALRTHQAKWYLHVEDTVNVEVDMFEQYLDKNFRHSKNNVIVSSFKRDYTINSDDGNHFRGQFQCGLNHVVSKCVAYFAVNELNSLFEYKHRHSFSELEIADVFNITSERHTNVSYISKGKCNILTSVEFDLSIGYERIRPCPVNYSGTSKQSQKGIDASYSLFENPSIYLQSDRFDLIVKMVYAYYYASKERIPNVIKNAYVEHIKVWNNFSEYCRYINKEWFDAKRQCEEKRGSSEFVSAFQKTIDTIKTFGFNSSLSRIPIDKKGFLLNGAHRVAAAVVLSKYATFEHHNYEFKRYWGYLFFKSLGLQESTFDIVMLELMKLQLQLPYLKSLVSVISVFSNNFEKDDAMRKIVKDECSKDKGIVYEKTVEFTKNGARQLIIHMYGQQPWLETKIKHMLSKFKSTTLEVLFIFIYGKETQDLLECKEKIRKLYNDKIFKSTVHIPDNPEENLILAEMILNPNSLQFMNHAKDASDCKRIAGEIASRTNTPEIRTLPKMYIGRDDIMVDSGTVLGFFGLRKRTDVDILFLQKVDKSILGDNHGLNIQAHAFKFNSISNERAWGEDHFCKDGPKNEWDLFYDPENFGYCYGIKFVSLKQLIRYKQKRNEPNKDQYDVDLVKDFLKNIGQNSCSSFCNSSCKLINFLVLLIFLVLYSLTR